MSPGNPPAPGEARGPPKSDLFDMCLILFAFFCTYWPLLAFEIILGFEARRYTRELGTPGSPGVPGSRHYPGAQPGPRLPPPGTQPVRVDSENHRS